MAVIPWQDSSLCGQAISPTNLSTLLWLLLHRCGINDYAAAHQPQSGAFYLSLGDREERSRPPILTTIATAIRHQQQLLEQAHVVYTLEWNLGNHFQDNGQRTDIGFVWTMENLLHR